ncbi:MAG: HEAT repeat domain-containing protein [Candidatus Heimdallarchaeota archaeon]|nr:HEAT repeat domain-containing protein [Candidatus Heimdallarchaeota archaeon]
MDYDTLAHQFYSLNLEKRKYIPDKIAKLNLKQAIPLLGNALLDKDEVDIIRNEAAEALGKLGFAEGEKYLKQIMTTDDEELLRTAIWSLGHIRSEGAKLLICNQLNGNSQFIKKWALIALQKFDQIDKEIIDSLLVDFKSNEDKTKIEILRLVQLNQHSDAWRDLAIEILQSTTESNLQVVATEFLLHAEHTITNAEMQILLEIFGTLRYNRLKQALLRLLIANGADDQIYQLMDHSDVREMKDFIIYTRNIDIPLTLLKRDEYTEICLIALLKFDSVDIDITPYLIQNNLKIQLAALALHAKQRGPLEPLIAAYERGMGKAKILSLLAFYDGERIDLLEWEVKNGAKQHRRAALDALMLIYSRTKNEKIKNILEDVMENERVWYFRLDVKRFLNSE